jgi:hypothetical protein
MASLRCLKGGKTYPDDDCRIIISAIYSILDSLESSNDYYNAVQIMNLLYELQSLDEISSNMIEKPITIYFYLIDMALENYLDNCSADDFDRGFKVQKKVHELFKKLIT